MTATDRLSWVCKTPSSVYWWQCDTHTALWHEVIAIPEQGGAPIP